MAKKKNDNWTKLFKAVSVAGIIYNILLFLIGVALLAFFIWLGVKVGCLFGLIK